MEEVKIQGGKVLDACREVQIQVRINIYQDGDHDDNADYNLTSGDIFDYDDAVQASGAEEIKQLYLEAEQLLVWVTYKYKLKQKDTFF